MDKTTKITDLLSNCHAWMLQWNVISIC